MKLTKNKKRVGAISIAGVTLVTSLAIMLNGAFANPTPVVFEDPYAGKTNIILDAAKNETYTYGSLNAAKFVSGDKAVATVVEAATNSSTTITAQGAGMTTVTAGTTKGGVVSKAVQVYDSRNISEYTLNQGDKSEIKAEDTVEIDITTVPEAAESSISWSSLHEDIATVTEDGTITGVANGMAIIVGKLTDKWGTEQVIEYGVMVGKTGGSINVVEGADGNYYIPTSETDAEGNTIYVKSDADGNIVAPVSYFTTPDVSAEQVWFNKPGGWLPTNPDAAYDELDEWLKDNDPQGDTYKIGVVNGTPAVLDKSGNLVLNEANFPDPQFLSFLMNGMEQTAIYNFDYKDNPNPSITNVSTAAYTNYSQPSVDTNGDGVLSLAEINGVKRLIFNNVWITDKQTRPLSTDLMTSLKGIEFFKNLEDLQVHDFKINTLNNEKLPNLKTLMLSNLDPNFSVSYNTELVNLLSYFGTFENLDLSNNTKLVHVEVTYNHQLESIDLSKQTNLKHIKFATNNSLTSVDVSNHTNLKYATVAGNSSLTSINTSGCTSLVLLDAYNNINMTSLNVTGCTALKRLTAYIENALYATDGHGALTSVTGLTTCKELELISLTQNSITTLNVSGLTKLRYMYATNNNLSTVTFSGNTSLGELSLQNDGGARPIDSTIKNKITALNLRETGISSNTPLLKIQNNGMTQLFCKTGYTYDNVDFHLTGNPDLKVIPG